VPLERSLRLLGVRASSLVEKNQLAASPQWRQGELLFTGPGGL
jgi:hypothetical protein